MQAHVWMTNFQYDHTEPPSDGQLPLKQLDIGEELHPARPNKWVIPTHYRQFTGDRLRQVAIRLNTKPTDCVVMQAVGDKNTELLLRYDEAQNVWYQPAIFAPYKSKGHYVYAQSHVTVGLANAGTIEVAVRRDGQVVQRLHLHFVPAAIKMADYEEMVADLFRIREQLVRDDKTPAAMAIREEKTLMTLETQLQMLQQAMQRIQMQPHKKLTLTTKKKKPSATARFDLRAELEAYVSPGQPKYTHRELVETTATYENALILQLLQDLRKYAALHSTADDTKRLTNEQNELLRTSDLQFMLQDTLQLQQPSIVQDIKHRLQKNVDRFILEEQQVRQTVARLVNYQRAMPTFTHPVYYVEVELQCAAMPDYAHDQSAGGLVATMRYDNREPGIRVRNYSWRDKYGTMRKGRVIGHFGEVSLKSPYVAQHALLHGALHQREAQVLVIKGFVNPAGNDVSPVQAYNHSRPEYPKYAFNYEWITAIEVNGVPIEVPQTRPELQAFLAEELPVRLADVEAAENAEMCQKQFQQLLLLEQQKKTGQQRRVDYKRLQETVDACLALPLFQTIQSEQRLVMQPTALFLHDPNYQAVWRAAQAIEHEIKASLYATASDTLLKTAKVEQIFEVWVLYKMLALATQQMGWTIEGGSVVETLDRYLLLHEQLKNFQITLTHGIWQLDCYYEPRIHLINGNYVTPDFVFRYKEHGVARGLVILDAKYRDYHLQGDAQWQRDVQQVAMNKYGALQARDMVWRLPILHSGIIHCDESVSNNREEQHNPYHVLYNGALFEQQMSEDTAHRYGSIYMLPSQIHMFKNWFRMIFEYHLKRYHVCWHCGEQTRVMRRELSTKSGYKKYHYTCKCCHEFWVKVHCRKSRHHLVKHTLNYHLQVRRNQRWFVVCPCCNDGR